MIIILRKILQTQNRRILAFPIITPQRVVLMAGWGRSACSVVVLLFVDRSNGDCYSRTMTATPYSTLNATYLLSSDTASGLSTVTIVYLISSDPSVYHQCRYIGSIIDRSKRIISAASISTCRYIAMLNCLLLRVDFTFLVSNAGHRKFSYDGSQIDYCTQYRYLNYRADAPLYYGICETQKSWQIFDRLLTPKCFQLHGASPLTLTGLCPWIPAGSSGGSGQCFFFILLSVFGE